MQVSLVSDDKCSAHGTSKLSHRTISTTSTMLEDVNMKEAAVWPSGLGRWCCNPEVLGSRPPPCHKQDLFLGSPEFKSSVTLCK